MKLSDHYKQDELDLIESVGDLTAQEFFDIYKELEDELESITDRTSDEFVLLKEKKEDLLYYRCATDIELFSLEYFSHYCTSEFNDFHLDTFDSYTFGERGIRSASCAPRGFAKSTIEAVIKPVHDICYRLERYIVVVSNTKPQAISKLKDIKQELEHNASLIDNYGPFFNRRTTGTEDFIVNSQGTPIRIHAVGSGTEIRGARFINFRPTKIVNDDVEHSEHTESEEQREKMQNWFTDVISKIGANYTNIRFVGTVLHQKSLLKFLLKNPRYDAREYKAIIQWADRRDLWKEWAKIYCDLDNDGRQQDAKDFYTTNKLEMDKGCKVLWPDEKSYYRLQEEIIEIGYRSFMKEMQNDPLSNDEKPFSPADSTWCSVEADGVRMKKSGAFIPFDNMIYIGAIDPASGKNKPSGKKKPDYTCLVSGWWHEKTQRLFVVKDYTKRVAPSKYITAIFEHHQENPYVDFGVEYNLYRELLTDNIIKERNRLNDKIRKNLKDGEDFEDKEIKIRFHEILLTQNKHERIYTLEPKIFHGNIVLADTLSPTFLDMLWDFPFAGHDDAPDALEMLWGIAKKKYKTGGFGVKAKAK